MPMLSEVDTFEQLPLWGQALIAARMVRRGALALTAGGRADAHRAILDACDAIERCAIVGDGTHREEDTFQRGKGAKVDRDGRVIIESLRWAIDAAQAAQAANDFPVDATVGRSARIAIATLKDDWRISAMQLTILMASDIDQVRFACGEARIGTYNGLTNHVIGRLAPVRALTLIESRKSAEDEAQ